MQLNGKVVGEFEVKRIRFHEDNNLREAICVLRARVKHADGAKVWGDDFMGLAFAGMRPTDDGNVSWACEKMTNPSLVCELHNITINGQAVDVQPEIPKIIMVKGEPAVEVPLTMRIDLANKKLAGEIAFSVGAATEVLFEARQRQLPGTNSNAPAIRVVKGPHGNPKPSVA